MSDAPKLTTLEPESFKQLTPEHGQPWNAANAVQSAVAARDKQLKGDNAATVKPPPSYWYNIKNFQQYTICKIA